MTFTAIDVWIGRTLFVPPIIKVCQLTGQSQFAVSRLFWFIAALDQFRIAETMVSKVIAGLFSLAMMASASLRADLPALSMMWFRMLALGFLVLDIMHGVSQGAWKGIELWILVLFAEYAATIRTIPPSATARKSAKAADVSAL